MDSLSAGSLLQSGKYKIVKTLGQGGFGITYLAEQVALDRQVAIKEFFMKDCCERDCDGPAVIVGSGLRQELADKFRRKFIREAKMIAGFSHQGIVRIFDIFEENGTAYYVMEYILGGSLAELVKNKGCLSENDAEKYIRQTANALNYIHNHHTVHLDIKPANILLDDKGDVLLIDFGISKHYDDFGEQTSTSPVCYSKGFAPIEQGRDGDVSQFGPSTDIYSLGATLYYLLTGVLPPEASIVVEDGLERPKELSERMWKAIDTAMKPRKKDRPQSIDAFLALLKNTTPTNLDGDEETIFVKDDRPIIVGKEFVDLGLPSGVKWATRNLGAKSPEDFGDYYAWGEISPKHNYSWSNYKYRVNEGNAISKYCNSSIMSYADHKTRLEESDDAAHEIWKERWHIPTKENFEELIANCICKWDRLKGVQGYTLISKLNGNSVFFPAAGYWDKDGPFGEYESGSYWSSSVAEGNRPYDAWQLFFMDTSLHLNHDYRHRGLSIRPIID